MKITNEMLVESQMRAIKNLVCQRHLLNNNRIFRKDIAEIKQRVYEEKMDIIFDNLKEECKKYER